MKAISPSRPAMPATAPMRSDRSSEASAADEAFGALIAAAIGATPRPVVSHDTPDKRAASSVSSAPPSQATDRTNSKADADQRVASGADQATATASNAKPADSTSAPVDADAPKPVEVPVVAVAKPAVAPVVPSVTPVVPKAAGAGSGKPAPTGVPAGFETAAAALAQALTTDSPAKPAGPQPVLASVPVAPPASALVQGQVPAQLVKLPALASSAEPAKAGDGKPTKPAGTTGTTGAAAAVAAAATDTLAVPGSQSLPGVVPAEAAAPQVAPSVATISVSDQHDAPSGKGEGQHSASVSHATPQVTGDAKAAPAPAPFDQTLQAPSPVANVAVPAPVQPVAAAVTQAAQAAVTPPADQIVQVVAPLRTAKDGDYTLSLQLHPAELGPVTVRVDVHQGVLSVHMMADNAQGHDALNQSLNDLRSQLEAGGVRTGDIGLGSRSAGQQMSQQQAQQGAQHQPADTSAGRDGSTDRRPANSHRERVAMSSNVAALDVRI
jgi:flagellar hook-length control protein FliK